MILWKDSCRAWGGNSGLCWGHWKGFDVLDVHSGTGRGKKNLNLIKKKEQPRWNLCPARTGTGLSWARKNKEKQEFQLLGQFCDSKVETSPKGEDSQLHPPEFG